MRSILTVDSVGGGPFDRGSDGGGNDDGSRLTLRDLIAWLNKDAKPEPGTQKDLAYLSHVVDTIGTRDRIDSVPGLDSLTIDASMIDDTPETDPSLSGGKGNRDFAIKFIVKDMGQNVPPDGFTIWNDNSPFLYRLLPEHYPITD